MIDKLSWFFIDMAYAEGPVSPNQGSRFFNLFNPFSAVTGNNAQATFGLVITRVTFWLVAIASVIAFIYLVVSGIQYITAGGDAEKATKARSGILNAIIGIVVIALAWVVVSFAAGLGKNLGGINN